MPILAVIALHVGMGFFWAAATLATAVTGRVGRPWPVVLIGAAGANMLAGIFLWHALHRGAWGRTEHLLVVGTFCAFVALGVQLPIVTTVPREGRLKGAALKAYRATLMLILAAATAMLASKLS